MLLAVAVIRRYVFSVNWLEVVLESGRLMHSSWYIYLSFWVHGLVIRLMAKLHKRFIEYIPTITLQWPVVGVLYVCNIMHEIKDKGIFFRHQYRRISKDKLVNTVNSSIIHYVGQIRTCVGRGRALNGMELKLTMIHLYSTEYHVPQKCLRNVLRWNNGSLIIVANGWRWQWRKLDDTLMTLRNYLVYIFVLWTHGVCMVNMHVTFRPK